ncbi:MAG: DUF4352 domain-containing protein [Ardenticatenales bacterium]|nr:DUF4352 domain-containing protein [Ardenticatenales bacterium]
MISISLGIIGALFTCILGYMLLSGDDGDTDAEIDTQNNQFNLPVGNESLVVGISDNTVISVTLDAPILLDVAGRPFSLQRQALPPGGNWQPLAVEDEGAGIWVYGTVVNYVVGLPDTDANRFMLDSLTTEDELVLTTQNGADYRFVFNSREDLAPAVSSIYAQNMPGITVILIGSDDETRTVVRGQYVVATAQTISGQDTTVELGQTAQLGDMQVTVTGVVHQFDQAVAPAGFDFYLVDYQLQNLGAANVDPNNLRMTLRDSLGTQYAMNPLASQVGNLPPLTSFVAPGQTVAASIGYQIPSGLTSPTLSWVVIRQDTGAVIEVTIPFQEGAGSEQVDVSLQQAQISSDGSSLFLIGQVTNIGTEQVVVDEQDVSLLSNGTLYLVFSTNPGFPWVIPPGQTVTYALTFQRPNDFAAIFSILGREFQLNNLR